MVPEDAEAIALYRAILSTPDDDTVRYAYADRVERAGYDDYAEFVRLQLGPRPATEREKELWVQYRHQWFGSWFGYTDLHPEAVRRGFLAELHLPYADWIQYRERLAYRPGWFLRCEHCFGGGYDEYPPVACQYCHGDGFVTHPLPVRDGAPYGKTPRRWPIPVEQIELTTAPALISGTQRGLYQLAGSGLPHEEAAEFYEEHIVLRLLRRCWPGVAWSVADSSDPESSVERERRRID